MLMAIDEIGLTAKCRHESAKLAPQFGANLSCIQPAGERQAHQGGEFRQVSLWSEMRHGPERFHCRQSQMQPQVDAVCKGAQ